IDQEPPGVLEAQLALALQELVNDGGRVGQVGEEVTDAGTEPVRRDLAIALGDRLQRRAVDDVVELVDTAVETLQGIVGTGPSRCGGTARTGGEHDQDYR